MPAIGRRGRFALVALAVAASVTALSPIVWTRGDVREVRVVARGMQYHVDGVAEPNPVLRFGPGEQVRLSLRNEDKGMTHDLRIPEWNVGTTIVAFGEEDAFSFRVPDGPRSLQYACTPHSAMMGGEVVVQE
jgi:hypothetical protein